MSNKTHAKKSRSKQKVSSARVRKRTRKGYRQLKKSRRAASSTPSSSFSNLRISLILILFSAQCVTPLMINRNSRAFLTDSSDSSKTDPSARQNVFNSGSSSSDSSVRSTDFLLSDVYNSESDPTGLFRVRRNPGTQFSDTVQILQRLARISSGIALEVGLIDGTISPDDAITELLRMGDLKPQDIIGLDQNTVNSAFDELTNLPKDAPAAGVAETENRLVILENVREKSSEFLDFSVIPGKEVYKTSLTKVDDLIGMKQDVTDLKVGANQLKTDMETLKNFPTDVTDQNKDTIVPEIEGFARHLTTFENLVIGNTFVEKLKEAKKIQGKSNFILFLIGEEMFRAQLNKKFSYVDANINSVKSNVQAVYDSTKTVVSASEGFESIKTLVDSRDTLHRQSFKYSAGLPHGLLDLEHLQGDSQDKMIKDRVSNSSLVAGSLQKSFSSFASLSGSLKSVETKWGSLNTVPGRKSVNDVISRVLQVTSMPKDVKTVTDNIDNLIGCNKMVTNYPPPGLTELQKLHQAMNTLSQKLNALSDFTYWDQLKDLDSVKKDVGISASSDKNTFASELLKKLGVKEPFISFENNLKTLIEDLQNIADFIANAKLRSVVDLSKATGPTDATYLGFFKCLNDIQVENSPVKHTLKLIQDLRTFQVTPDAQKIINGIVSSGDSVKSVVSTAADLKKVDSREAKGLGGSVEKSYLELSKKLGLAVQGLSAIALVQSTNLTPLLSKTSGIQQDAATLGLAPDHQKSLGELVKIPGVQKEVNQFLNSFQGQSRRKRQNPNQNFKSFESIFQQASGLKGASIDLKSVRMALEALNSASSNNYAPELGALEKLEKLDLDFTRFNFGDAIPTLSAMDNFFLKYTKEMSKPVKIAQGVPPNQSGSPNPSPGSGPPSSPSASGLSSNANTTTEKSDLMKFMEPTGYILCGAGVAGIILGIVLYCCHCCCSCCYKKKAVIPDDDDLEKQDKKRKKRDTETDSHSSDENDKVKKEGKDKDKAPPKPSDDPKKDGPNDKPPKGDGADPLPTTTPKVEKPFELAKTQEETAPPAPPPPKPKPALTDEEVLILARVSVEAIRARCQEGVSVYEWAKRIHQALNRHDLQIKVPKDSEDHMSQRRYHAFHCKKNTMAKITGFEKDPYINVNEIRVKDRQVFMGQGVLNGTETECLNDKKVVQKKDTRPKQFALFDHNNVGVVAQLCRWNEESGDDKSKMQDKCAEYYSEKKGGSVEFGDYKVTTKDVKTNLDNFTSKKDFTLYELEYLNKKTGITKNVDVLAYSAWPDAGAPLTTDPVLETLRFVEAYDSNIYVHCSAGIGRTGCLVATMYGIDLCLKEKTESVSNIISHIRNYRFGAIQTLEQLVYLVLCITKGVMNARNIEYCQEYDALVYYHEGLTLVDPKTKKKRYSEKMDKTFLLEDDKKMLAYCETKKAEYELRMKAKEQQNKKDEVAQNKKSKVDEVKKEEVAQEKKEKKSKVDKAKTTVIVQDKASQEKTTQPKKGPVAQDKASQEKAIQDKKDPVAQDKKDKKSKVDKVKTVETSPDKLSKDKMVPVAQDKKKTSEVTKMLKEGGQDKKVPTSVAQFKGNPDKNKKAPPSKEKK